MGVCIAIYWLPLLVWRWFPQAAKLWRSTSRPFEETALQVLALQQSDALLAFILHQIQFQGVG